MKKKYDEDLKVAQEHIAKSKDLDRRPSKMLQRQSTQRSRNESYFYARDLS